jgi:hypothetical protein
MAANVGLGGSGSWGSGDVWDSSVSAVWVSVEAVTVGGVRIGDVLNNSGGSSGGVDGRWVTSVRV